MIELSSKTRVDKKFRLNELFKLTAADKTIKDSAKNVLSVTLTNVLSKDTLNLRQSGAVKEIYVFVIELSSDAIPAPFITALDKAINLHTIFVLRYNGKEILYGCYKQIADSAVKLGKYYSTDWQDENIAVNLPISVSCIDDVYTAIIDLLIPIAARPEEPTGDFVVRYDTILKLDKEIEKLQRLVDSEKQSKKRFELNERLKELKRQRKNLNA